MKLCITGANSSVGKNLLNHLSRHEAVSVNACVRSERAFSDLPAAANIKPVTIAYDDPGSLEQAMAGVDCVIHLAGILIESKHSNYASANVAATAAVAKAAEAQAVKHLIFISVIGASPASGNAYFRSKGSAEELVKAANASGVAATVLRTPILLGANTAGGNSLLAAALGASPKVLGGGTYTMRPLDTDDLSAALVKLSLTPATGTRTLELVGPEPIQYRELIKLSAGMMGREIEAGEIGTVPLWIAKLGAAVSSTIKGGGITPTVIDVITTDEKVEQNADALIGIELTPLRDTIKKVIDGQAHDRNN